jgi:predicted DNA-binding protein (MmcQ/YjbR family)
MARHKWVFLNDINRFSKKQWEFYIKQAYELVGSKLPIKKQIQLGLMENAVKQSQKKLPFQKVKKK